MPVDEVGSGYEDVGAGDDELYTGLSDGEIEEDAGYSDISSDENFLDDIDGQRIVSGGLCVFLFCVVFFLA